MYWIYLAEDKDCVNIINLAQDILYRIYLAQRKEYLN
jgi:hypothetical protein